MAAAPGIATTSAPPNTVVAVQPGMNVQPVVLVDQNGNYVASASSVMTTLGDTLYENATPAPARLAGNTTATKNFLTQTGTGVVSAAPAWGTIAVGDLPTGTTGWIPADNGLLVCNTNTDPAFIFSSSILSAGTLYLAKIPIRQALTITNLWFGVATAGSGTSTQTFCGLWNSSGTLLSGSSDVATPLKSQGFAQCALTTPQALAAGTFVWAGLVCNLGTTQPTLVKGISILVNPNFGLAASTFRFAVNGTSVTSLGNITPASNTATNALTLWVGGS